MANLQAGVACKFKNFMSAQICMHIVFVQQFNEKSAFHSSRSYLLEFILLACVLRTFPVFNFQE